MPKLSIVIRTADRTDIIARALNDISHQTCQDFEIIIVNDGAVNDTLETLVAGHDLDRKTIILTTPRPQSGRWVAANVGLEAAQGEYFNLHDDDDTWDPKFIEKTIA